MLPFPCALVVVLLLVVAPVVVPANGTLRRTGVKCATPHARQSVRVPAEKVLYEVTWWPSEIITVSPGAAGAGAYGAPAGRSAG